MRVIRLYEKNTDEKMLDYIASSLKDGAIVIYPTDSVYAIGCDALNVRAVEKICNLKGVNPTKANFSIIGADISSLSKYVKINDTYHKILRKNLPGPFTFILPTANGLPKLFKTRKSVGIRIPSNSIPVKLTEILGNPILTTSLKSKENEEEYYTNPELIAEEYDDIADIVIDGGIGNTIVTAIIDCTSDSPKIVRDGAIEPEL